MATIYLICEGPADGLDVRVLNTIIAQKLGVNVIISPAGGDSNLGSVANWHEEQSRQRFGGSRKTAPPDRAYTIQDRNYSSRRKADESWRPNSKRFIWRRHEIENYLLEPRVIARAFSSLKTAIPSWPSDLPQMPDDIEVLLQQLADPMLEDHVGRVVYLRLVEKKQASVDTRINRPASSLNRAIGQLYPGRQEWLNYLHEECRRTKNDCRTFAELSEFDEAAVMELYDQVHADFISRKPFLEEMGGHELMSALLRHLNQQGVSHLSLRVLEDELIGSFEQDYQQGYFSPDDFDELANRLV